MPRAVRAVLWGFVIAGWPAVFMIRTLLNPGYGGDLSGAGTLLVPACAICLALARRGRHARYRRAAEIALARRVDRCDTRLDGHDREMAGHGEWLAAQDAAWQLWRDARSGPPELRVVSGS